jgi:A/G-specific adenine glycosylase
MTDAVPEEMAPALLRWAAECGRHDLPWQRNPTPYRVWVSEVMLQQTQVTTVLPYFQRFVARFPNVASLAETSLDNVLSLWTGLGYYARACNLHRAARLVVEEHGGRLPEDIESLMRLPGIGRSTAGAILALSCSQRRPILDANARRVLARYFGVDGEPHRAATQRRLWELAEACTPQQRVAEYTQAIMDLGAIVCTRVRPHCDGCPLRNRCLARREERQQALPAAPRRAARPCREGHALAVRDEEGRVLLQKRPAHGLWGGLWSLPAFDDEVSAMAWLQAKWPGTPMQRLVPQRHAFTHFDLTLHMLGGQIDSGSGVAPSGEYLWHQPSTRASIGLTRAVTAYLQAADRIVT